MNRDSIQQEIEDLSAENARIDHQVDEMLKRIERAKIHHAKNAAEIEHLEAELEKPAAKVYIPENGCRETWNLAGHMDYLAGTVQEVLSTSRCGTIEVPCDGADPEWPDRPSWMLLPGQYVVVEGSLDDFR